MIKFLHISDVHLNKTFASKNKGLRDKLSRAVLLSFKNAIAFCIQNKVDALVIVGDLFDNTSISLKYKRLVIDGFEALNKAHINVYYASGNHDFTSHNSEVRNIKYPSNVYLFHDDKYNTYPFRDDRTNEEYQFVGCGHIKKHESRNLISTFPVKKDKITIGIAHTMVNSSLTIGDEGNYLPSSIQEISSKNYDYFALGHIHQNGGIDKNNRMFYSGALQALSSKETGAKGGYLVSLDSNRLDVDFIELSSMKWINMDLALNEAISSLDSLYEAILSKIKLACEAFVLKNIGVEINLHGKTKLFKTLKNDKVVDDIISLIVEQLDLFDFKINVKNIKSQYNKQDFIGKKSLLGKVLEDIESLRGEKENTAFDFLNFNDHAYIDDLLENMEDEVMNYFLEDKSEN